MSLIKGFFTILAILLVLTFVLHAFVKHEHHDEDSADPLKSAFHGEDRKWLTLLALASLVIVFAGFLKEKFGISYEKLPKIIYTYFDLPKIFNPILEALRTGILNPKLCA